MKSCDWTFTPQSRFTECNQFDSITGHNRIVNSDPCLLNVVLFQLGEVYHPCWRFSDTELHGENLAENVQFNTIRHPAVRFMLFSENDSYLSINEFKYYCIIKWHLS